jgi:hypothetical protein
MTRPKFYFGRLAPILAAVLIPVAMSGGAARADSARIRGTVVSLEGSKLVVHAKDGKDVSIMLADKFGAIGVVKASMADIKPGAFIGTATTDEPNDLLRSLEVVVFPEAMKGVGEGHFPWDLPGSSKMTNATVSLAVDGVKGQTVTVTYKGGEKKIEIPADIPIVTLVPATAADIHPGDPVFVPGDRDADGAIHAGAVIFGKDGVAPPM